MVGQLDTPPAVLWGREPLVPVEVGDWVGPRAGIDAAAWFVIQPVGKSLYSLRYLGWYMGHSPPQTEERFGLGFEFRMSKVQAQRESPARLKALMQCEFTVCWQLRNQMQKAARYFVFIYKNRNLYCLFDGRVTYFVHSFLNIFLAELPFLFYRRIFLQNYTISLPPPPHPALASFNFFVTESAPFIVAGSKDPQFQFWFLK
jgi:hypothetical protein